MTFYSEWRHREQAAEAGIWPCEGDCKDGMHEIGCAPWALEYSKHAMSDPTFLPRLELAIQRKLGDARIASLLADVQCNTLTPIDVTQ